MIPALGINEPYASAIIAGIKTFETRSLPPNGGMRPDGVRGFPGVRLNRGDRIIIAATARKPVQSTDFSYLLYTDSDGEERMVAGEGDGIAMYPGHILGTVTVTDAIPIVGADQFDESGYELPACIRLSPNGRCLDLWPEDTALEEEATDISDQLPWGNWDPGNWAWQLADPKTTNEMCPVCDGEGVLHDAELPPWNRDCTVECERRVECTTCELSKAPVGRSVPLEAANGFCGPGCSGYRDDPLPGDLWPGELSRLRERQCFACDGDGQCDPFPVRGHQGLRPLTPEQLR